MIAKEDMLKKEKDVKVQNPYGRQSDITAPQKATEDTPIKDRKGKVQIDANEIGRCA
jgi:hypothetical protein